MYKAFALVLALFFSVLELSHADKKTGFWELGLGVSAFQTPHYLGSNQSENYILPYPHVRVETDLFSMDRNSINGHMLASDVFRVDISFSGALKVNSEDNSLRQGMADLDYIFEVGPSLNWLLWGEFNSENTLSFDLPIRSVWATDFKDVYQTGWRATPTLHWFHQWQKPSQWQIDTKLRLLFGTDNYHDYFYTVTSEYATTSRIQYEAESGFGGWQYALNTTYKNNRLTLGFILMYSNISSAVYKDSPLVNEDKNVSIGIYASWVLVDGQFKSK